MPEMLEQPLFELVAGADLTRTLDALFVNAPLRDYAQRPRVNDFTLPVLGMGYLATYAASRGFNVGVLDAEAHGLGIEHTIRIINESARLGPTSVGNRSAFGPPSSAGSRSLSQVPTRAVTLGYRPRVGKDRAAALSGWLVLEISVRNNAKETAAEKDVRQRVLATQARVTILGMFALARWAVS